MTSHPSPLPYPPQSSTRRHPSPLVVISKPTSDSEIEHVSQLKIASSSSTTPNHHSLPSNKSKLCNPNVDPIPMRCTAEPEPTTGVDTSHVPRTYPHIRGGATTTVPRQLFDPRKDDRVQFHIQSRPHQQQTTTSTGSLYNVSQPQQVHPQNPTPKLQVPLLWTSNRSFRNLLALSTS
jgi:hypothetical protein